MSTQRVGELVDTTPAKLPQRTTLEGLYTQVAALDIEVHGDDLYRAATAPGNESMWTYLPFGPWNERGTFDAWLAGYRDSTDYYAHALIDRASGRALGMASYLRAEPTHRVIEIGSIWYSPSLQRTRVATEAMYLLARNAFETLGYRRYEWKCNTYNDPSRRAALRLGFTFEGVFRQHMITRGRNRDTAWFSMLDSEWPQRKSAFERWLDPANFDAQGRQQKSLAAFAGR